MVFLKSAGAHDPHGADVFICPGVILYVRMLTILSWFKCGPSFWKAAFSSSSPRLVTVSLLLAT